MQTAHAKATIRRTMPGKLYLGFIAHIICVNCLLTSITKRQFSERSERLLSDSAATPRERCSHSQKSVTVLLRFTCERLTKISDERFKLRLLWQRVRESNQISKLRELAVNLRNSEPW